MSDASTIYTLNAEAAAARCRELLTTDTPPPAGRALEDRKDQPPSIVVKGKVPYKRRMWCPAGVDQWCAERQPPRIRRALNCLGRIETVRRMAEALEAEHGLDFHFIFTHGPHDTGGVPESLVDQMGAVENILFGILAAEDEP